VTVQATIRSGWTPPGPESQMVEEALLAGFPLRSRSERWLLREPSLDVGQPDLVFVYGAADWVGSGATALSSEHLRLLHLVHQLRWTTLDEIIELTCTSPTRVRRAVGDLVEAQVVYETRRGVRAIALPKVFGVRRIVAIEAKMGDWRGAVLQAARNTWFASDSYVLLPRSRCTPAALHFARRHGVGVYSFERGRVRRLQASKRYALPCSYGSWVFNEWLRMGAGS